MKTTVIEHDHKSVWVTCPKCKQCEEHPVDEQRSHLQEFSLLTWIDDLNEVEGLTNMNEYSVMRCKSCSEVFLLEWDFQREKFKQTFSVSFIYSELVVQSSTAYAKIEAKSEDEAYQKAEANPDDYDWEYYGYEEESLDWSSKNDEEMVTYWLEHGELKDAFEPG